MKAPIFTCSTPPPTEFTRCVGTHLHPPLNPLSTRLPEYIHPSSSSQITLNQKFDSLLNGPPWSPLLTFHIIIDTETTDPECKMNQRVYKFLFRIVHFIGDGTSTHLTAQSDDRFVAWLKAEWTLMGRGGKYVSTSAFVGLFKTLVFG